LQRLSDPPGRKGGEWDPTCGVEPLQRSQEPDDPFLEQISLLEPLCSVTAGRRLDERQQPTDQFLARGGVAGLGTAGERVRFVA
jgi:hypothetical protein